MRGTQRFAGRGFGLTDLTLIRELVHHCGGLSRVELAATVGERLRGQRPSGALNETCVHPRRFRGGGDRAANWLAVGETAGRGRMDRHRRRVGAAPKPLLVYPLCRDAARRRREA